MFKKLLVTTLLVIVTSVSFAADKRVRILLYNDYPPFTDGTTENPEGLYPAIIRAAFVRLAEEYSLEIYPWSRALNMAKDGKGIIAGIYKTDEREQIFHFSDWFYQEEIAIYQRSEDESNYSAGVASLDGKMVGINRGWSYGLDFDDAKNNNKFKTQEATNDEANLKKLLQGRIDVFPMNSLSAKVTLKQLGLNTKIKKADGAINLGPVYLAASKKVDFKPFIDRFNKVIKEMKEDGSLEDLVEEFVSKIK